MDIVGMSQQMKYYLSLKINKLSSQKKTWQNLKSILLSERSQSEKTTYCMIPTTWHSGKDNIIETVRSGCLGLCRVGGGNEQRSTEDLKYFNDRHMTVSLSTLQSCAAEWSLWQLWTLVNINCMLYEKHTEPYWSPAVTSVPRPKGDGYRKGNWGPAVR